MSQTDNRKSVDTIHHRMQFPVVKDRQIIRQSGNVLVAQRNTTKTIPIMSKKEEIRISPARQSAKTTPNDTIEKAIAGVTQEMDPPQYTPTQKAARQSATNKQQIQQKRTAAEIKSHAIEQAIRQANASQEGINQKSQRKSLKQKKNIRFGFKRLVLALACTTAAVFAIVYFVNINTPDISLRVAAIQNGINASYPKYTPRGFSLTDITSENGKITLNFKDSTADNSYTLIEEKSSWDSNALFANYVKPNYEDDHTVIKEQGLTLYINDNEACWVNGGIFYKLKITNGSLTKKQIKAIATSL